MPVFNGARYLRSAVDSILTQSFGDYELVICDNASTDETRTICEEYAVDDGRVHYYRNFKNLGAAPNYNRAFTLSRGEYFKWADYDDVLAPSFLQRCVDVLDEDADVSVCFTKARLIDDAGAFVGDCAASPDTCSLKPEVRFGSLILARDHRLIHASGLLRSADVRKTVLHGSYPCSDEVLMVHLALLGRYHEIDERLLYVRVHSGQSTHGVLASERARVLFFDTSLEDKAVRIKWLYLRGCVTAIKRCSIGYWRRFLCCIHLCRWLLRRQNQKSLMKDALLAIHETVPLFPGIYGEALDAAKKGMRTR
jgi:glycosyltransferase involved in cell wall biosynthesis